MLALAVIHRSIRLASGGDRGKAQACGRKHGFRGGHRIFSRRGTTPGQGSTLPTRRRFRGRKQSKYVVAKMGCARNDAVNQLVNRKRELSSDDSAVAIRQLPIV